MEAANAPAGRMLPAVKQQDNVSSSSHRETAHSTNTTTTTVDAHQPTRRKAPVLTTLWLDADASTYEALCTAGASAITAALSTSPGAEGVTAVEASNASATVRQLIPQEWLTRKRPRPLPGDGGVSSSSLGGCSGGGVGKSSAPCTAPPALPSDDADARLDVLEEVELCSIVPRLARTFGVEQLVQQVVPCTAFFAPQKQSEEKIDVEKSNLSGGGCLAHVRAAADRHMWMLHTAGAGCSPSCTPVLSSASAAAAAAAPAVVACTSRSEGGEGSVAVLSRHTSRCDPTRFPPIPPCMRGTSLDVTAADNEDDGEAEEAHGETEMGAHSAATTAPLRTFAGPRPVRLLNLNSVAAPRRDEITTPSRITTTAAAAVEQPSLLKRESAASPSRTSELCLPFAAAQARYAAMQKGRADPLGVAHELHRSSDTITARETHPHAQCNAQGEHDDGTGATEAAKRWLDITTPAAPSPAQTAQERRQRGEATAVAAAAAQLQASTAAYFRPHTLADSLPEVLPAAVDDAAERQGTAPTAATVHPTGEETVEGGESGAELYGSSASPLLSQAPPLPITQPAGAVVEWVSGVVSYTADTEGLMQEQQARAQRTIFFPPPMPTCGKQEETAETRTALRGAVLAQLQRLRHRRHTEGTRHHAEMFYNSEVSPSADPSTTTTSDAAAASALSSPPPRRRPVCPSTTALPCPCVRCSPLQLQFAQVPAMASATLRHYVELLHQSSLPTLQHPFPPARHVRTADALALLSSSKHTTAQHRTVDPLDAVLPLLRQVCALGEDAETGGGVRSTKEEVKREEGERKRKRNGSRLHALRLPQRAGRGTAVQTNGVHGTAPASSSAAAASAASAGVATITAPLGGVDDAVLDETVVIGVVPRGQPHQLRLVAPSRAFVLMLMQRLEEAREVAAHILCHVTCPFDAEHTTVSRATWQACLEEAYNAAMWTALAAALTVVEWEVAAQIAAQLPFFPPPPTEQPRPSLPDVPSPLAALCTAEETARVTAVLRSVRAAAETHTTACLGAAEDATARVILTALTPLLHRRITVMYELLRHTASPSLYASHRSQCEAYQQWYAATPSPQAILRLLQRSARLRYALARCYPQYALLPVPTARTPPQLKEEKKEEEGELVGGTTSAVAADGTSSFPAWPQPAAVGVPPARRRGRPRKLETPLSAAPLPTPPPPPPPPPRRRPGRPRRDEVHVVKAEPASDADGSSSATAVPPSSASSTPWAPASTHGTTAFASGDASPHPFPSSNSRPSSPSVESPFTTAEGSGGMRYVPEVALLDPRYLQRFAWWTHRTYHAGSPSSSSNSGSAAQAVSWPSSSSIAAAAAASSNPVMNIPGDYLRVVSVHEQDAAIRAVLRSMTHRGRTMDLWEMAQHMQAHGNTSYVYL